MKVIIYDKCKKPINIKDVRHIVVRTEETEHILDFFVIAAILLLLRVSSH